MNAWPKISVVTACRNADAYVGQAVDSVTGQEYPNLQYVVIDGASTDDTMDVLRRRSDAIDVLFSEPDDGQYHGIQKGLDLCDGEVLAWLNADDAYMPWTLQLVGRIFRDFPDV